MKDITYTLTCDSCGNYFYSKEALPKQLYCKTCMMAVNSGRKEVVDWLERCRKIKVPIPAKQELNNGRRTEETS